MDWALEQRQALGDMYLALLLAQADELMSLTRYLEARKALSKALEREPLRDDIHGRMLLCLSGIGRRHEVVDHYRRYRERLRTELGLDPPQEIRTLYSRLLT
jgi:DNA-binding SARP family transcriptional activator